jgi:predicted phosphodiesterase
MKFQIISDIHLERLQYLNTSTFLITPKAEYLILVGDICNIEKFDMYKSFLKEVCSLYKKVFLVPGNNEYYSTMYSYEFLDMQLSKFAQTISNLIYLNSKYYDIDDVRIYGSILWSCIPPSYSYSHFMPIKDDQLNNVDTNWINKQHESCVKDLTNSLSSTKKNLVVTHYPPTFEKTMSNKYTTSRKRFFYANELSDLINSKLVHTWVYGHTHINSDFIKNETRIISNQFFGLDYSNEKVIEI